jgi:para-nitrobenzyl esterase
MRAFLAAVAISISAPALAQSVTIASGKLEGVRLSTGVRAWYGVPFAAPPVRDLRWRAPQAVAKWPGIFHADRPAPMCLQPMRFRTMNHYFGNEAISEDCLYLNVWSPLKATKAPVIVWIYGGGFNVGSANMANYDGGALAAKGVVRVNLAYRVGVMGFLAHPGLSREANGASGNYGLMDQIAGLKWVQQNIKAFGGDPNNVTIAGQSAGSMSVALLQQSPMAKGLFHKIVGMSGSPFGPLIAPTPLATAESQGVTLQNALGASSIEAMRDVGGDKVLATAASVARDPIVIDGKVLTGSALETFGARKQSDVPVMLGFTRDEAFSNFGPAKTVTAYDAAVRKFFPDTAEAVLNAYPAAIDADVPRALADLQRDASVGRQMAGWAKAQNQFGKAPVFGWYFTRRQPYAPGITFSDHDPATVGAYHTGEVPYFFQTLDALNLFRQTRDWTADDRAMADALSTMLVSFAKTGRPAADWPAFHPARPQLMRLDLQRSVVDWPNYAALDLLDAAPTPRPPVGGKPRD